MTNTLTAGKEMDAAVAEKVMGWHLVKAPFGPRGWSEWQDMNGTAFRSGTSQSGAGFHPSTEITAAWQVVEWMRQSGWFGLVGHREWGGYDGEMYAEFSKPDGPEPTYWARANTAPLAVCRAALAAVGYIS